MNGYIKLNREITEHWIWKDKPFTKGQAWIDLLFRARWQDGKEIYKGVLVDRKRGNVYCSMSFLAKEWGWDRRTVRRFIGVLESDGMVSLECTTHSTTITIENYSKWQDSVTTNSAGECTTECTTECTQKKKEKKEKKNNIYSRAEHDEIIAYLNSRIDTHYRSTTKKTNSLINARLKEGFTVSDFKTVIDVKADEWKGTDMERYLRPETLFGTKFESYLNQKPVEREDKPDIYHLIARKMRNGISHLRLKSAEQEAVPLERFLEVKEHMNELTDEQLARELKGAVYV